MKDLVEKGLVLVQGARAIFDKKDGERRKCPRCKGCGLFASQNFWQRDKRALGNEPCWFCEGVGVMPLYGLNGFMFGRASAAINSGRLREPIKPPVEVHLCLGKYPESRSKFSSFVPEQKLSSLLYKPGSEPTWISDAVDELALQRSDDSVEEFSTRKSANFSLPKLMEGWRGRKTSPKVTLPSLSDHFGQPAIEDGDQVRRLSSSGSFGRAPVSVGTPSNPSSGGIFRVKLTRKTGQGIRAPALSSSRLKIQGRSTISVSKENDQAGAESSASKAEVQPRLTGIALKRPRTVRRRRNQVREKLERETNQNTLRMRKLLSSKPETPIPEDPSESSQSVTGSWKDTSQRLLAELTSPKRLSSKTRSSQVGPAVPYPSLTNRPPLYDKLAGKLPLLPNISNP